MEDEIERNQSFLYEKYNNSIIKNKVDNMFLYIYIPKNGKWEDFVITNSRDKAYKLLKNKEDRIEIFKKDFFEIYKPTFDCLFINNFN